MNRINEEIQINNRVIEFLKSKGFPNTSILQEVSVSEDLRKRLFADIILINEVTKDYLAVIEVKRILNSTNINSARQQILSYLRALNRYNLMGYIIGLDEKSEIAIYSVNKDGIWELLSKENFPNYNTLIVTEEKKRELFKTVKKKKNIDNFLWICIGAAVITGGLFIASLLDLTKLDEKEMTLLLITIGLVIIPFVAKLEILGIVFERKSEK